MKVTIKPANPDKPHFVGHVEGVDARKPLAPQQIAALESGLARFGVLVLRDQQITDAEQIAFSRSLGELEHATGDLVQGADRRLPMELNDISNLDRDGKLRALDDRARLFGLGNRLWHSDSSFKAIPARFSLLSARVLPAQDGNTEFADMRAAWDTLDRATQAEIRPMIALHSQLYSRAVLGFDFSDAERQAWAPVRHPLVRRHGETGRLTLYLSAHIGAIEGLPIPEARALLRDLTEHATQRERTHAHVWQPHDLVIWDNRITMHRARPFPPGQVRDMRRTTITDEVPTLAQPHAA